jgi:hypothetical protein
MVALAMLGLLVGESRAVITDGLVSYWPLDGNLDDTWGDNEGTLVGTNTTPVYDAARAAFGQAIDLDGVDQYIDVGNDASLDMSLTGPAGNGHVSISAWFRVDAFDKGWQALIAKGEGSAFRVARRSDNTSEIAYAGGSGEGPASGRNVAARSLLHHMAAISINGVETQLWIDGVLDTVGPAPTIVNDGNGGAPNPVNPPLWIGNNPQTDNRTWNGLIDDVAIWNRPLTTDEIAQIWNGGTGRSIGEIIPEPGSVLLMCAGAGLLLAGRRRR